MRWGLQLVDSILAYLIDGMDTNWWRDVIEWCWFGIVCHGFHIDE